MLVRMQPEDVEIGMFVHAFIGSWFDHPFWRSNFRIETSEQLEKIRNSGIDGLMIDANRGVAPEDKLASEREDNPRRNPTRSWAKPQDDALTDRPIPTFAKPEPEDRAAPSPRRGYGGECRRAKRTIDRTREAVIDMFDGARLGRAVEVKRMVKLASAIGASIERDA